MFLAVTALDDPEPPAEGDPYLHYGGYYGLGYAGYKHPYAYVHRYLGRKRRSAEAEAEAVAEAVAEADANADADAEAVFHTRTRGWRYARYGYHMPNDGQKKSINRNGC